MALKTSVVVPTYNRPEELRDCIQSIMDQTVKPNEIIVVDDGDLSELPLEKECRDSGIRYHYHKKDTPGLTASRNAGIGLADGDIIFFFDDDVVLFLNYIEEILKVYELDGESVVGGAGGAIANKPMTFAHYVRWLFDVLFLVSGCKEGKALLSGFCTNFGTTPFPIRSRREVDFLPGCAQSYRKEVFGKFSFSREYRGYGLGEDKDFSYRVSKECKLVVNPDAKLYHYRSPKMRYDKFMRGREYVLSHHRFFKNHVKKKWWSWLFFYYALTGYMLSRIIIMTLSLDKSEVKRVMGILGAVKDIVAGRVSMR